MNTVSTNGWNEYRRRVLFELGEHDKQLEKQDDRIRELEKQLAIIITKVTLFGAIAGLIAAVVIEVGIRLFAK